VARTLGAPCQSGQDRTGVPPDPQKCATPLSVTLVEQVAPLEDVFLGPFRSLTPDQVETAGAERGPATAAADGLPPVGKASTTVGVESRPTLAERPPDPAGSLRAEKRLVEPDSSTTTATVQHHTLQLGDHEGQRLTTPNYDLQLEY